MNPTFANYINKEESSQEIREQMLSQLETMRLIDIEDNSWCARKTINIIVREDRGNSILGCLANGIKKKMNPFF